jgi:alpha-L-arabinofuranosidase
LYSYLLAALFVLNIFGAGLFAQSTTTNIAIGSSTIQPSVKRLGINLGTLNNYDSGQIVKNLVIGNPGFEGQIRNSTIRCASGTATSCTDENQYEGWTADYWDGATYQFFYGAAAGRSGTISTSTAPGSSAGITLNFNDSGVAPQAGDYMIVRKTVPGGASGGWFATHYGNGSVSDNLTDLPPGTLGKQTVLLNAPTSSDSATISSVFDSTNTLTFVQLNGNYQLQFKAKALYGSDQMGINVSRGNGGATYISQYLNLSTGWTTYTLNFTANETGSAVGSVTVAFSTVYGPDAFELDDVSLTQTNGDPSNTTVFSDPVVNALRTLQPGIIRYWGGNGQLAETLDNLLTPAFGRQRADFSQYSTESDQIDYGLHEFLALCQLVGAEPWFVVPSTFTTTDAANLMEYLAGASTTTYGAKRAALGQTAPWTQVFSKIHLEFGNEEWNNQFSGGTILYADPYGRQAQVIFSAMQGDAAYTSSVSSTFDFVLGGQAASPGYNLGIQNNCTTNTSFTIAPYLMNRVDSYSDNESLFGSAFAEPEAFMSSAATTSAEGLSPGEVSQNSVAIQNSSHPVPLSFYEINLSTLQGAIASDQAGINSFAPSLGGGLVVADTMLLGLKMFGVVNQNLFALPQYHFTLSTGNTIPLWGSVVDMGVTDRRRPQYLALELANQALSAGAAMVQTTHTGADPTWNESTITNTVQFTGAHYLQSYAFVNGTNLSAVVFNLSRTATLPVTFSGANAPAGTVQMQQLTSANITDNNESSDVVNIVPSTLTSFSGSAGLSLPPYSMTVLTWSTSAAAPVISSVRATVLSATSATITWTTDQLSTSQVNYGTSSTYGSSASGSSTPSTSHSVTLTGLTAGTTYNYEVVSANSASPVQTGTSANFTFTTSLPAPVISAVSVTGITPTAATITWTTDQAATSQVSFGTSGYGSTSVSSTLTTSHSITLTGLLNSTTYDFDVSSANSAGTFTTSSGSTFSTLTAPVISAVTATKVTPTSATITWTTDQATTSQVVYGTTTNYGASSNSASYVTAHSMTLTGLSPNTTYDYVVISADNYGLSTSSGNFTFSTATQGPAISYVVVSGITNTSATITWTTDTAATSQVQYGTTTSYGSMSALNSSNSTTHSVTLTGLTLGTTYDYSVISTNSTNVTTSSANFMFTTSGGSSSTNIAINSTALQPSVKRMGISLGTLTNYDSGLMTKNLITANPGFEGQIWNSTIRCASGTTSSCTDENTVSNWPAGFWNGASYQVFYGAAAGRTGTVATSTAASSGQGITLNFADVGPAPAAGDYIIVRMTVPGGSSGGWFPYTTGNGTVTDNFSDLPPGTQGKQTVVLTAPGSSDSANLSTVFDSSGSQSFIQLNGTYQLQFKAKGLSGSNQVGINLVRGSGTPFLSETVNLTNSWNTYNLSFSASEDGSATGSVSLAFATAFGADSFELDDVSLTKTNSDQTNTTVFRDSVLSALRTLQPGILRYWGGNGQLGETLDNLITPQFGRQRAGYSAYLSQSTQIDYGLHEFLVLCQTIGAEPWFVVPSTFSTVDAYNLIDYLASASTTTYGAKRAALGQTAPWTQVFSKIHLQFGEQEWNSAFAGGSILYPLPYGSQAQTVFSAMKGNSSYSAASIDLVLGGQATAPGDISTIQGSVSANTSFAVEPYAMSTVNSYSDNESLFGSTFAEAEAFMSTSSGTMAEGVTGGMINLDYQAVQSSSNPVPLSFSEVNLSTFAGTITQTALNSYVSSLGAGLMVADTMLQGLRQFGVVNQNLYSLPGYDTTFTKSQTNYTADLFGSVIDMGVTYRKRPQYLAVQLANQALSTGAAMLQTVHSGANPTWDEPLTNSVYLNGAHYLQSFAFSNGSNFSTVVFNLSRTATLPVTFSGTNAPAGTVQMQQLTSANLTDTNETTNPVAITSSTLTAFSGATGLSLPPYSMTVLTWSTSTAAPVISSVAAIGVTSTTATITWTTDQASSSSVNYGTSTAQNSALVTSHSVALTGLTPGTTYSYTVASGSSTSSSYSFTTAQAAPVISAVSVSAISATSATITWTTDQAASSQVFYGTTGSYGLASVSSALSTSHSITISGLVASTTYNFAVSSANAAGASATSSNSSFSTANPPVISSVLVTVTSATSATITWTTDQASSSQVVYGTSLPYGSASPSNATLVTSHSVTLTGLTTGATYNYAVLSANAYTLSSTSANYQFTASLTAPVISSVTATAAGPTSEMITWTTNQATSSLVNYGATSSYGSSSTLNSTLGTTHSVTLTGLTAGTTYNFDVVSANSGGTSASSTNGTFTTVAGTPVISAVMATSVSSTSETITWTTDQPTSSLVNYGTTSAYGSSSPLNSMLSTTHSVTLTGLTAGTTYSFDVVSANSGGASATSANATFTTAAGTPVITAITATSVSSTSETITWTTDQPASSLVNYGTTPAYGSSSALNNTLSTSHSVTLTGLIASTSYNFDVVSANSGSASATSANATFTTAAGAPIISAVTATAVSPSSETITWTTDQPSSSLVNYGATTSYGSSSALSSTLTTSHSVTITGLTSSTAYNFDVVSANAGNLSATSPNATFTTQAGAPVITAVAATAISPTSETITWTTDQPTSSLINYGSTSSYGSSSPLNSSLTTVHSVTLTGLTASSTYSFDVVSANANSISATSPNSTFTTSAAGTPVISAVMATSISSTSETITWTTDQPTSSLVNYGPTSAYGSSSALNNTLSTTHSITLTGLTASTAYNFDVVSANASATSATSANAIFTTVAGTPVITAVTATSVSSTSETITWTTDQATSSLVNYGATSSYGSSSAPNSTLVNTHSVTLTGLTAGATYNFDVVSANAGGISANSANATFTTAAGTPVITAITATSVSSTSETITWTTDQPTSSLVNYGATSSYGSSSALNNTLSTSHSVTLTGLTASTSYNFDVVSANSGGTSATSTNSTFTTAAGTPVITAVTAASVSSTSETITWTTDQPTSSLVNYGATSSYGSSSGLNNTLSTTHSVTLTGLTASTSYNFDVVSANAGGTSANSANATFTTAAGTPVITAVTAAAVSSTSETITWTTDQPTSSLVNYGRTQSYGSSSAVGSSLVTMHSVTLTGLTANTVYDFDVVSVNASSVSATSPNSIFTTQTATPVISAVTATAVSSTSETITWTTDQATSSLVNYGATSNYGSSSALNSSLTTSHSVTLTGLSASTTYNFDVVSANSTSVSATSSNSTFTTQTAAPVISAVTATAVSSTSETITWTTDQATSSLVNYGATSSYGSSSTLNSSLTTAHSVTLTGLTAGTTYNFDVVSANSTSVSATSTNSTFTTRAATPVISAVTATSVSSTSETITWTTDQATSSLVNYGATSSYGSSSTLNSSLVTSHSVTLTGLTAGTTYNFDVVSANSSSISATSANATFTTATATPPYVGYVAFWGVNNSGVTISWSTDVLANTELAYGTTTALGQLTPVQSTLSASHGVVLTGLNSGTTYYFVAEGTGANGATGYSSMYSFTTTGTVSTPTPVISAVTATSISSTSATITWTTDQATSSQVNYGTTTGYGSASPINSSLVTSHSVTLTGLTAGTTYNYDVVSANSSSISTTSTNFTFTTSTVAGAPVISSVTAGSITGTSAVITWTTDLASTSLVNYGTATTYGSSSTLNSSLTTSHSVTLTGLTAGSTYNYDVVSATGGGLSTTSANFTFTTVAGTPVISNVTTTGITSTSATVTWTTDQATSSLVNYGTGTAYGSSSTLNSTLTTSHSVTLTGLTAGTTYDFDVVSANSANTSATSTNYTFTTTASTATPPYVGYVAYWGITNSSIVISWSTDVLANTVLAYGTTTALGQLTPVQSTLATSHGVTLTGLNSGTTYYFVAESTGANGATGYSTTYSFTTTGTAGTSAPAISAVSSSGITGTSATITWTTDQASTSLVNYGSTTSYGSSSALSSSLVTSHSVTLTGLASGTTYNFDVVSANSGGTSSSSTNYTFTTTGSVGTPVISAVTASSITSTSATITWTTDQATSSLVNYGTSTAYGSSSTLSTSLVTSHSVTLSGLTAGTTYYFDVVSANSGGTSVTSTGSTFTTTTVTATPPYVGYVAYWGVNNSSVVISWSTDVVANTVLAYGTTTALGQFTPVQSTLATSHGVTLTGLNSGTTYYFVAESTGANGATGYSATYSFTTTGTASSPAPVISAVTASSITGTSATITWTTDQASSSLVNYGTTTSYGSASTLNTSLVTSHSVTLTGLTAGTTYNFDVVSANASSVSSNSSNATFTTTGSVGTPVISAVASTGVTNTSATITWTTDQATSSLVKYGTTTSYGSSSTLNSSLVTSHSVTLTGLTAGTTYDFVVVSANSANTSATSANSTFTTTSTTATPPNVGYVVDYGITSSGATISWSTDVTATTQLAYGTTAALGTLSPLQSSLSTSHGVVLTGLASGTTYYFVAQSTGSNGATGYSTTYSFTTMASSLPTISAIKVTPASGNTATISWTTSIPTTSYVQFGTTTSYNRYSTQSSLTASPSLSLGYVPSGTIHYQLVSTDQYGNQVVSADATFTEP